MILLSGTPTADFYPRPPRGGRHVVINVSADIITFLSTPSARRATVKRRPNPVAYKIFLSTPSARRATASLQCPRPRLADFYPRPPRGGRPARARMRSTSWNFYPRPPRGGRQPSETPSLSHLGFLSTPSARRATSPGTMPETLSIHFYPRPPRGGRPTAGGLDLLGQRFLSTPSARRATSNYSSTRQGLIISIHALREEGDP